MTYLGHATKKNEPSPGLSREHVDVSMIWRWNTWAFNLLQSICIREYIMLVLRFTIAKQFFLLNNIGSTRNQYNDVIMSTMTSQIASFTIDNSTVYSGANQRIHQSSASLVFVRGIHQWPVNSPHKGPVMRKMFPFDNVIMCFFDYPYVISLFDSK